MPLPEVLPVQPLPRRGFFAQHAWPQQQALPPAIGQSWPGYECLIWIMAQTERNASQWKQFSFTRVLRYDARIIQPLEWPLAISMP